MRTLVVALAGLALLVTGVVVLATSGGPTDFGWFAYTPLDDGGVPAWDDVLLISTGRLVAAVAALGLGLALLAGLLGFRLGRRVRPAV